MMTLAWFCIVYTFIGRIALGQPTLVLLDSKQHGSLYTGTHDFETNCISHCLDARYQKHVNRRLCRAELVRVVCNLPTSSPGH